MEDESEVAKRFLKTVMAAVGIQIVINWLYGKCQRRFIQATGEQRAEEAQSQDEESEEDFEVVSEAGTGGAPETNPEDDEEIQSKERVTKDEKDAKAQMEGQSIFVTRSGESFHIKKSCGHLKNYTSYERFSCEKCSYRTMHLVKERSQARSSIERFFEGDEVVLTTTDQKYHHPECKEARRSRVRDKRTKCLDCIKWYEGKSNSKKKDDGLSQHQGDEDHHQGEGRGSSSSTGKNCKDEF